MIIDTTQTKIEREIQESKQYVDMGWVGPFSLHAAIDTTETKPVHKYAGKWWFWCECWEDRMGPYENAEDANKACNEYVRLLYEKVFSTTHNGYLADLAAGESDGHS